MVEELDAMWKLPVQVTIASGFPKGGQAGVYHSKSNRTGVPARFGPSLPIGRLPSGMARNWAKKVEKLEKIVLGAAEQSKRNLVPSVTLFEKNQTF